MIPERLHDTENVSVFALTSIGPIRCHFTNVFICLCITYALKPALLSLSIEILIFWEVQLLGY